jgi:hypothetical protein
MAAIGAAAFVIWAMASAARAAGPVDARTEVGCPHALAAVVRCAQEPGASQDPEPAQDPERLRAMLAEPGADGRLSRETAVERLLVSDQPAAHRLLQEHLFRRPDPDALSTTILTAFARHLLGAPPAQFGGAGNGVRREILVGYTQALAPLWSEATPSDAEPGQVELRRLARLALQRVPGRELVDVAGQLLAEPRPTCALLRCLGDLQQPLLAPVIARQLEAGDAALRSCATEALQFLCYPDEPLRTKAQFELWQQQFGDQRYLDLVERAARGTQRPQEGLRQEISRLRVEAARDVVRALVVRSLGIDWAAVHARTVVDEPEVLAACLEQLQQTLGAGLPVEDAAVPRQAFGRALLQRYRASGADPLRTRAMLLEVAAYLTRPEETELAAEVVTLLLAQLELADRDCELAALRGLRRFPGTETRARLVAFAHQQLERGEPGRDLLAATLGVLSARTAPRWAAPLPTDADKADWLRLVAACCRSEPRLELREPALMLAQTLDGKDGRVVEVFPLLLDLVHDAGQETKFRSTALILLQGWRNEESVADAWVAAVQGLLADPEAQIRLQAAESLGQLTESVLKGRVDWINSTIFAVRDRLEVETDAAVLRNLVDCMQACGREPQKQAQAIGALKKVIGGMPTPVPADQQFRLEPLLQALATIAADSRAELGQWTAACLSLQVHRKRQSLRLVLQSHSAVDLAKEVGSTDPSLATGARQAMRLLIDTALLKPPREAWSSSEELVREARDVRTAFNALDTIAEALVDSAALRLLRLEVDLAAGKPQDVVQKATQWLAATGPAAAVLGDDDRARIRCLAAEAQLALGRPDAARRLLDERGRDQDVDPAVVDLQSRIGRALVATDLAGAVQLFERVLGATPPEDPTMRARLLDWMQNSLRLRPESRPEVMARAAAYAAMFAAPDCPLEQRDAFEQMRTSR